jgi:methyl-accepting chemotaxis protein
MFRRKPKTAVRGAFTVSDRQLTEALHRAQAIIEFQLDGTIVAANENFLSVMGYTHGEIVGKHHRMFVDPAYAETPEYKAFWKSLASGEYQTADYRRFAKGGKAVWIQATYNPIFDKDGKPIGVVKFATDVSVRKRRDADAHGQLTAISRSQAVIEFETDGTIITANPNFCSALGYGLDEIVGKHHRIFVDPAEAKSREYGEFWDRLREGKFQAAEYRRIGKGGREVWIQATYNPIFAPSGRIIKIVKFATDITARKNAVRVLGDQLTDMADGTIVDTLAQPLPGEFDDIRLALKSTLSRFASFVRDLKVSANEVRSATASITAGAGDLADRTDKQGQAVDDLSGATQQLSGTVMENAQRAELASQRTHSASDIANQTGVVFEEANKAMVSISESASKIAKIIEIIDDVAFQTNLLALNASVEAARAGEAGKGFAVVAIEVRRLAQSTASASAEVKGLIETSGREVEQGTKLVSDANAKVEELLEAIGEASRLVAEIAGGTKEQAVTIGSVSDAVKLIDQMTRHNIGLVRETNEAVADADHAATALDEIAEKFTTEKTAGQGTRMRAAG